MNKMDRVDTSLLISNYFLHRFTASYRLTVLLSHRFTAVLSYRSTERPLKELAGPARRDNGSFLQKNYGSGGEMADTYV